MTPGGHSRSQSCPIQTHSLDQSIVIAAIKLIHALLFLPAIIKPYVESGRTSTIGTDLWLPVSSSRSTQVPIPLIVTQYVKVSNWLFLQQAGVVIYSFPITDLKLLLSQMHLLSSWKSQPSFRSPCCLSGMCDPPPNISTLAEVMYFDGETSVLGCYTDQDPLLPRPWGGHV